MNNICISPSVLVSRTSCLGRTSTRSTAWAAWSTKTSSTLSVRRRGTTTWTWSCGSSPPTTTRYAERAAEMHILFFSLLSHFQSECTKAEYTIGDRTVFLMHSFLYMLYIFSLLHQTSRTLGTSQTSRLDDLSFMLNLQFALYARLLSTTLWIYFKPVSGCFYIDTSFRSKNCFMSSAWFKTIR